MRLTTAFIVVLLSGLWMQLFAQTVTILNKDTGEPVSLATLSSNRPKAFSITNAKGQADISGFKNADRIEIRSLGFRTEVLSYQEIEEMDFEVFLTVSNLMMDEMVVSATRWRQLRANIPSKVITIYPRVSSLQNPQTAADLLSFSGKVYIQKSQQGGGSPMIRGFATNRLLYTVDGVRMNTAIFRGGNLQNVINIDPFAVENTEVLFGPGSVVYGSDAIGGVMSFQTLTPQFSLTDKPLVTGKGVGRFSSANNENTYHLDINLGWKKWAFVSSLSSWDFDHLRQGSKGPEEYVKDYFVQRINDTDVIVQQEDPLLQRPSAYSQINLMQKVRFQPSDTWDLQYGFHFSETSPYGRYDRHNRTRNGTARYALWNYGPQLWQMNKLSVNHTGKTLPYDQMTIRLALQNFEESRIDRSLNDTERSEQTERVDAYSVNIDFTKALNRKNTLYYGLEYILNEVDSRGRITDITDGSARPGPSRYPQAEWSSVAAYLDNEFRMSGQFTLQAGLRYNQYILNADFDTDFYPLPFSSAKINNGSLTGTVGGVWRPDDTWVLSTNFGTAFRSPNVDDAGKIFDSEPGAVTVPNPDLKAEYAYNFDIGAAKIFPELMKVDVTGYYTILNNALVRRDYQLNGQDSIMYDGVLSQVQAIQNAARANVYGLQVGFELKLPWNLNLSSDLNVQKGEEELDDGSASPSRHAAPLFGMTRLSYAADRLNLQFYAMYQGEKSYSELSVEERDKYEIYAQDDNGNNYSPAWHTLNFKAMYELNEQLTINAGVENITDRRYRPYSSGISGPGRNYVFSLQADF